MNCTLATYSQRIFVLAGFLDGAAVLAQEGDKDRAAVPAPELQTPQVAPPPNPIDLQSQLAGLQKQIDTLRAHVTEIDNTPASGRSFLARKPGDTFTLLLGAGEVTIYGYLDVSFDVSTKGIAGLVDADGQGPAGNNGWLPDISTNLSYVGVKGFQRFGHSGLQVVVQLETQIDIAATSGSGLNSNAQSDTIVKGGLTSRNSYLGVASPWGAIKFGKTYAPYRTSTERLNPFVGMWGDYASIMGNTGGDNRVEFGMRLDHSIWYESPRLLGFQLNVLFSPGQNRGDDSEQIAAGASSCTGGNIPGSGGTVPLGCTDGGFDNALSADLSFQRGGFYITAAYEFHQSVNRTSDLATLDPKGMLTGYDPKDIAHEDAMKLGVQYTFLSGTSIGGIFERVTRYLPDYLQPQNDRSRMGLWLTMSQQFRERESIHLGWAHAFAANGDLAQHNTETADGIPPYNPDNSADLFTVAFKHKFGHGFAVYADYAATWNRQYAHYALGAGGRAVATDCHDAQLPALGGTDGSPRCWAGGLLQGFSLGMSFRF